MVIETKAVTVVVPSLLSLSLLSPSHSNSRIYIYMNPFPVLSVLISPSIEITDLHQILQHSQSYASLLPESRIDMLLQEATRSVETMDNVQIGNLPSDLMALNQDRMPYIAYLAAVRLKALRSGDFLTAHLRELKARLHEIGETLCARAVRAALKGQENCVTEFISSINRCELPDEKSAVALSVVYFGFYIIIFLHSRIYLRMLMHAHVRL